MPDQNSVKLKLQEELCQSTTEDKHNPILMTGPQVSGQKQSKVKYSTRNFEKYSPKNCTLTVKDNSVVVPYLPLEWIYHVRVIL